MLSFLMLYSSWNDVPLYDSGKNKRKRKYVSWLFYFKTRERMSEKHNPACEVAAALWPA